jgi:hypothetical protein
MKYLKKFENVSQNDLDILSDIKDLFDFLEDDLECNNQYFFQDIINDQKRMYDISGRFLSSTEGPVQLPIHQDNGKFYTVHSIIRNTSNEKCQNLLIYMGGVLIRSDSLGLKNIRFNAFFTSQTIGYYRRKFFDFDSLNSYIIYINSGDEFKTNDIKLEFIIDFV